MIEGHGHVTPRSDGLAARCGGPMLCGVCRNELYTHPTFSGLLERAAAMRFVRPSNDQIRQVATDSAKGVD